MYLMLHIRGMWGGVGKAYDYYLERGGVHALSLFHLVSKEMVVLDLEVHVVSSEQQDSYNTNHVYPVIPTSVPCIEI